MSIADTEIIDTRYNQGGAFKSKEWEQVMKKQFQEEECLWNDSQLNINGGKEFSLNQTKIEVKRIDNELIDIIEDKQLQQRLSVSQVSRRYRLSMKLAKVELNRQKQMAAFKNKDCENCQFETNQMSNVKKTSKINELIENYPQFVSNIEMLTKIKIRMKQFYKSFTTIYRSRLLNRDMRIQINDKSDIIENKQHWLMKIEKSFSKISILKYFSFPLFKLSTKLGFYAKLFLQLISIMYFFLFSIFIVFQVDDNFSIIVCQLINYVWIADFFFNINSQMYYKNQIISERGNALSIYIKSKLVFDMVPLILNWQVEQRENSMAFQILQFVKLFNIYQDLKYIQLQLCMRVKQHYIVQLINLIFRLFLIAHIIACCWYIIGYIELKYTQDKYAWLAQEEFIDAFWWQIYFSSLYWSLTLMSTGSNICQGKLEIMFIVIILLFSSIAFGYIITVIGEILSEMNAKDYKRKSDTNIINTYMGQNQISEDLQSQVNIYLQQYYENDFIDEQLNKQKVLDKLPTDLQQNLKREQFQGIINQIDCIFNKLLSQKTLQDLSQYIIEEFYFPNETLNFNKKQSLIFITQGEVQVFQNNQTLISQKNCEKVGTLSAGKQFGLVDFISGISSEVIVKSTMFTKIVKINREDFVNVVKKDDLEYQKFCELKDNINLYEQMKDLNLKCNFCQSYCHYDRNCNLINIDKKQLFLNQIFVQKTTQKRSLFKRHQNKNSNPLLIQCFINNQAQQFIYSIKKLKEIHLINQYNLTMTETDESQSEKEESSDLSVLQKQESEQRNSEYLRPASIIIPQKSDLYNRMQSTSVQNQQNKHSFKDLDDQQKGQEFCQSQKQDFHSEKFIVQNIEPIRQNSSNLMNEMRVTFRDIKIKDEADFQEFSDEKNESQVQASSIKKQQTLATKRQQLNDSKLLQSKLNAIFDSLNSGQKENLQQQIKEFATTYSFFKQIFRCNSNVSNANQIQDFKFKIPQNYIIDIGFDQHKDFENYFPSGNLKEVISRISKQLKKKGKKALKTNLKKEE